MKHEFFISLVLVFAVGIFVYSPEIQANYQSSPSYWQELLNAFYRAPTTLFTPKYTEERRNKYFNGSIRFSVPFLFFEEKNIDQKKSLELYEKQAPIIVNAEILDKYNQLFSLESVNNDWEIEKIQLELLSELTPTEKKKIRISGFGKRVFFEADGSMELLANNINDNQIEIESFVPVKIEPFKVRIKNVWLRNTQTNILKKGLLSGNTISKIKQLPAKNFVETDSFIPDEKIISKTVTPGESVDIFSFTYLPKYTSTLFKSIQIFEQNQNQAADYVIESLILYELETQKILATAKPKNASALFTLHTPIKLSASGKNEFRIRAKFKPVFADRFKNELRWHANPEDIQLTNTNTNKSIPDRNKYLNIKNATHTLADSRLRIIENQNKTYTLQNIGVKNVSVARLSFTIPNLEKETKKLLALRINEKMVPHFKKFSGNVVTVDFHHPIKILPNDRAELSITKNDEKILAIIKKAEVEPAKKSVYDLKQSSAYNIWIGNTNWYDLQADNWMNGSFIEFVTE